MSAKILMYTSRGAKNPMISRNCVQHKNGFAEMPTIKRVKKVFPTFVQKKLCKCKNDERSRGSEL